MIRSDLDTSLGKIISSLERKMISNELGAFWPTLDLVNGERQEQVHETIYNGVAGISLFFLELYKAEKTPRYREIVYENEKWIRWYCTENPSSNFSFLTGRMGVCYYYTQLYNTFQDEEYLSKAKKLARGSYDFIRTHDLMEYLNGISGTLLALLHLYTYTKETWILEYLRKGVSRIINEAHVWKSGIYWDRNMYQIHGLCGLSHGASGVGFVLMEIGNYFQQPHLISLGELAYTYEQSHFDSERLNWPDMRKYAGNTTRLNEFDEAYGKGEFEKFCLSLDSNLWCHGAAGIGLARLRAFEITGLKRYQDETRVAVKKIIQTDGSGSNHDSNIICHGRAGNMGLLLAFQEVDNSDVIDRMYRDIMASEQRNGAFGSGYNFVNFEEDSSLFMGVSGIGYILQKIASENIDSSVLLPFVKVDHATKLRDEIIFSSEIDDRMLLLNRAFPRTMKLLCNRHKEKLIRQLESSVINSIEKEFSEIVNSYSDESNYIEIKEAYLFEKMKLSQDHLIESNSLLYFSERANQRKVEGILTDSFDISLFKFEKSKFIKLTASPWDWLKFHGSDGWSGFSSDNLSFYYLRSTAIGIVERQISELSYNILSVVSENCDFEKIIASVFDLYIVESEHKTQLRDVTKKLIIDGVGSGLIDCSPIHT